MEHGDPPQDPTENLAEHVANATESLVVLTDQLRAETDPVFGLRFAIRRANEALEQYGDESGKYLYACLDVFDAVNELKDFLGERP